MEENQKLWNKKMDQLTVGDAVKINLALPVIMIGSFVAIGAAAAGYEKASEKFRKFKANRQNKTEK